LIGSAAPIAAFMATKGGGRAGPAPPKRPERSGGWLCCGYFAWRCKARSSYGSCEHLFVGAAENSRSKAIAGPDRLPQNVASQEGRLRGPFRMGIRVTTLTRLSTPLPNPIGQQHEPRNVLWHELDPYCGPH
jgi:hypothetical protein